NLGGAIWFDYDGIRSVLIWLCRDDWLVQWHFGRTYFVGNGGSIILQLDNIIAAASSFISTSIGISSSEQFKP
ncbi:10949_t:CDS:2, partial [Acaulospora morrowiae]